MTAAAQNETSELVLDPSLLVGDWRNTNRAGGIDRIVCEAAHSGLQVRCFGRLRDAVCEWGSVPAHAYSFQFDVRIAGAFSALYDLNFIEIHVQANVKAGVLVVASFNHFKDGSGRSSYFDREFFHRIAA